MTLTADKIFEAIDADHDQKGFDKRDRRKWWRKAIRVHGYGLVYAIHEMLAQAERRAQWIDPDRFVLRGRSGDTNPHDINHAALIHAALKLIPPLSNNGQCAKDVTANARSLNLYTTNLKPPYRSGLDTIRQFVLAVNEQLLAHTNFRLEYIGDQQ